MKTRLSLVAAVVSMLAGLSCGRGQSASDIYFAETFDSGTPASIAGTWTHVPTTLTPAFDSHGTDYALKVTSAVAQNTYYTAPVDIGGLQGRRAVVKLQVKSAGISAPPQPYNGIKVIVVFHLSTGAVAYSTQAYVGQAAFDWKDVCVPVTIPPNAASAALEIGLEAVSGTAWFDEISVEADPTVFAEGFDDGATAIAARWTGAGGAFTTVPGYGGAGQALSMTGNGAKVLRSIALPAGAISGHRVLITGVINAPTPGVSAKTNSYDGVEIMLYYATSDGVAHYVNVPTPVGAFDWTHVYKVLTLPQNVTAASLIVGLQAVTGIAYFDSLRLDVNPSLFSDTFDDGTAAVGERWTGGSFTLSPNGAGSAVTVSGTNASSSNMIRTELPYEAFRGRRLAFRGQVSTTGVSAPPQPYNGIKLMIAYQTSDGTMYYPQLTVGAGPFGWTSLTKVLDIPDDVTAAWLYLGLEKVTGTATFDNVSIDMLDNSSPYWVNPTPGYKGHSVPALRGMMANILLGTGPAGATDIPTLVGWKANLVRWQLGAGNYPLGLSMADADYDAALDSEMARLDAQLPALAGAGIHVTLDLHSLSEHEFDAQAEQDKLIAVWKTMAAKYKNSGAIWAYDIANEPTDGDYWVEGEPFDSDVWHDSLLSWNELAEQVTLGIREVDPVKAVIIEPTDLGCPDGMASLRPVRAGNVVYSFHNYMPIEYTNQGVNGGSYTPLTYPGFSLNGTTWNAAQLETALAAPIRFQQKYNVSLYVGEFSAVRWAPGAAQYLSDSIALFEKYGWDWSYHAFREWQGWNAEIGEDEAVITPAPTPTLRLQVLTAAFQSNATLTPLTP